MLFVLCNLSTSYKHKVDMDLIWIHLYKQQNF